MNGLRKLRDLPGVLVRDLPRYARALRRAPVAGRPGSGWATLCNRNETMHRPEGGLGWVCDWPLGSALHAPGVLPVLGRRLMDAALREWPIRFAPRPQSSGGKPKLSFVIAHAGAARVPQLRRTLYSLFAQDAVECEYIVIDQSEVPFLDRLPEGIIYRHLNKSRVPPGWRKSWAFNVGARMARSDLLVFHDGDICAPASYAGELLRAFQDGKPGAVSLQRLLFYLNASDTGSVDAQDRIPRACAPDLIFQNWKGGTIAVNREAFHSIGGFDEGFVDWGGEDDEFYDRCAEIGHLRAGYLPFVHLWHTPQANRMAVDNINTTRVLPARIGIPRAQRASALRQRSWGDPGSPDSVGRYV